MEVQKDHNLTINVGYYSDHRRSEYCPAKEIKTHYSNINGFYCDNEGVKVKKVISRTGDISFSEIEYELSEKFDVLLRWVFAEYDSNSKSFSLFIKFHVYEHYSKWEIKQRKKKLKSILE